MKIKTELLFQNIFDKIRNFENSYNKYIVFKSFIEYEANQGRFDSVLEILDQLDPEGKSFMLIDIFDFCIKNNDREKAELFLLDYVNNVNNIKRSNYLKIISKGCSSFIKIDKYDEALAFLGKISDTFQKTTILSELSYELALSNKNSKSLEFLDLAEKMANFPIQLKDTILSKINEHYLSNDDVESYLDIFNLIHDKDFKDKCSSELAVHYATKKCYEMSFNTLSSIKSKNVHDLALSNIAKIYVKEFDLEASVNLTSSLKNKKNKSHLLTSIMEGLIESNKLDCALDMLLSSKDLNTKKEFTDLFLKNKNSYKNIFDESKINRIAELFLDYDDYNSLLYQIDIIMFLSESGFLNLAKKMMSTVLQKTEVLVNLVDKIILMIRSSKLYSLLNEKNNSSDILSKSMDIVKSSSLDSCSLYRISVSYVKNGFLPQSLQIISMIENDLINSDSITIKCQAYLSVLEADKNSNKEISYSLWENFLNCINLLDEGSQANFFRDIIEL